MVKVSIIVPVYNVREELLTKCLESLVNQKLDSIEIILVDDASNNRKTINILADYNAKYASKVVLCTHEINKKQGGARNTGLNCAKGSYVGFVDADDYVDENMFQLLYSKAEEDGADLVDCDYSEVYESGRSIKNRTSIKDVKDPEEYLLNPGPIWSKIYSKKIIMENRIFFPENIFYEDDAISGMHLLYANKVSKVKRHLYYYVKHADAVTANQKYTLGDKTIASSFYIDSMMDRGFFDEYQQVIRARYFKIGFLNTYRQVIRYRRDYFKILKALIKRCDEYGIDLDHLLIRKQLSKKQKHQLELLFKYPEIFLLYESLNQIKAKVVFRLKKLVNYKWLR
ncbi:glycosyltransferase [Halieaceae bacterium IMCC14734]|uniref:Glycosyltransferase n=1 Tax=Candidatus Litorirhabdus singularis TaxID=2518993 RepID=A0ABT3TF66_9GAMM|nr:glycosyltransferase [Candidatus Litorirhabdus singularis]MCX2980952.1 glycosyltransferase [Candidatus Litorirhabdus singularis]